MADYERSTKTMRLDALPEPVRAAVQERATETQLTLAPDSPAFLTHNKRLRKPGLFARVTGTADKDTEHLTALVLGERDLVVATYGDQRGSAVLAARLEDVDVGSPLDSRAAAQGDEGVTVTGFPVSVEGGSGRGSFFFGLGAPDGETAREALLDAVRQAKSGPS